MESQSLLTNGASSGINKKNWVLKRVVGKLTQAIERNGKGLNHRVSMRDGCPG